MATAPVVRPFAMRGVELGITLDEFRRIPVPIEPGKIDPSIHCSDEDTSEVRWFNLPWEDSKLGILSCAWFSRYSGVGSQLAPAQMTIQLGGGLGSPTFQFIEQRGQRRLFRIRFYSHISDADGIPDSLTRGYGAPTRSTKPFQTRAGATYPATTLVWRNARSSITLTRPCRQLDMHCLTYEHTELMKAYDAIVDQRDAAAASRI